MNDLKQVVVILDEHPTKTYQKWIMYLYSTWQSKDCLSLVFLRIKFNGQ